MNCKQLLVFLLGRKKNQVFPERQWQRRISNLVAIVGCFALAICFGMGEGESLREHRYYDRPGGRGPICRSANRLLACRRGVSIAVESNFEHCVLVRIAELGRKLKCILFPTSSVCIPPDAPAPLPPPRRPHLRAAKRIPVISRVVESRETRAPNTFSRRRERITAKRAARGTRLT